MKISPASDAASDHGVSEYDVSDYVELHLHTGFSFLDGAGQPRAFVDRAVELGMDTLAVTDHQGLYGAVKFGQACREVGVRPIYGAEVTIAPAPPGEARDGVPADGSGATSGARTAPEREGGNEAPSTNTDARVRRAKRNGTGDSDGALDTDGALPGGHATLLVESPAGWANLCRMLTAAGLAGEKRDRPVTWAQLARHADGLICLTGCRDGVVAAPARRGEKAATLAAARRLKEIFGPDHCFVELQRHFDRGDQRLNATLIALAAHLELELVATNNVHYPTPEGFRLQHVLSCIGQRKTLDEATADGTLYATPHRYLKSAAQMRDLFADVPRAVTNTRAIADRCRFTLDHSDARLPDFPPPGEQTAYEYLLDLCYTGLRRKYRPVPPEAASQLTRELSLIEERRLADYFLVVHDIVAFARREGIACQGRGSAAGSIVAYVLDITPVDPLKHGLLFERFLSEDSHATPDIDVDFAADRREEVLQYVYRRWGAQHTAMVANVVTFRARSAVADVGKALGFPADLLNEVRRYIHTRAAGDVALDLAEVGPFREQLEQLPWRLLVEMCAAIDGLPRHLSIHVGGMIVTGRPLAELVPLEPATMEGRVVVQWDKDDVEDAGLIKIDLLGLRTLGMVAECFDLMRAAGGPDLAFDTVPEDDEPTWEMIRAADTIGCFQIESRAQLALQPRLQASEMADLIIAVSLIRPGPIKGGMAKAYLRRRDGEEPVSYWHPSLEPVLAETLGILVYQEQVLKVSMTLAGFTGGQADGLRRSMSRKRGVEAMERWRSDFVSGAAERGVAEDVAHHVFDHLLGFASYGFCKSHAAAFARVTWVTAWLKCHHALPFYCGMLNAQPMGFYTVEAVLEDARRHGVEVLPMHVNRSDERWTIEGEALRVPTSRLKGMPSELAVRIPAERAGRGRYESLWDFVQRTRPKRNIAERLVRSGALDGLPATADGSVGSPGGDRSPGPGPRPGPGQRRDRRSVDGGTRSAGDDRALDRDRRGGPEVGGPDRRQLLWALSEMHWKEGELALPPVTITAPLPDTERADAVLADYSLLGVAQGEHVMALLRPSMADRGITTCEEVTGLPHDAPVRVAGRLEVLQRPQTAKGIVFVTLEDETGMANLVIYPDIFERVRQVLRDHAVVIADGRIQHEHGVTHVVTRTITGVRLEADATGEATTHVGPKWGRSTGPGAASGSQRDAAVGPGKEFS